MKSWSDQKLDDQIALISQQLAKLKRIRRARKAAQASRLARQHAARDELIQQAYAAAGGAYGVVRDLARQYQLATRQIHRTVRRAIPASSAQVEPSETAPDPRCGQGVPPTGPANRNQQTAFDL